MESDRPAAGERHRDVDALLLQMADQRRFERVAFDALLDGTATVREAVAVTVGRIGDPRGRGVLQGLLIDGEAPVRRAAAFALGELGVPEAKASLLRAAVDDDPETGALAVEALGKVQAPLAEVRRVLTALEAPEAERRLAPQLFRFPGPGLVEAADELLRSASSEVRIGAGYALGRLAPPEAGDRLRALAGDPEPRLRAAAARGLGEVGGPADLARLEPLLADVEPSPRIQALRAGAKILGRASALPPMAWGEKLAALVSDPAPGVRATAIESSSPWMAQADVRAAILTAAGKGEPRERELALLALARGGEENAETLARRAAADSDRFLRARAAECAGLLGLEDLARALASDPEPVVRIAALGALLELAPEDELARRSREFLNDADPAVRASALDTLAEHPEVPVPDLLRALENAAADRLNDARLAAIRAVVARAKLESAAPSESASAVERLQRLAEDRDYLVRREAAAGLGELGVEVPAVGPVETGRTGPTYAMVLQQTRAPRFVELETERGTLVARLDCPDAPLTCLSFLQLAGQGYFDGSRFHRVVPDFVVQGGDPRGDGWGGPGYALRDEINRRRYGRGTLGMALSGADTGGSQFFFTLAPQPHLDGGYTVFGQVVSGDAVLDEIRQGDRLLHVKEVPSNE